MGSAPPHLGNAGETLSRAKLDAAHVDAIVMGQVIQAGAKMNPTRQAAVKAGVPVTAPAMTVNRVCGSGAQAIASVAQKVMLGLTHCGGAGGMKNMDQAPYLISGGRWGYRMGDAEIYDSMLRDGLNDAFSLRGRRAVMDLLVERVDVWAATIEDRPGGLAQALATLREAGADLQFVIARRAESGKGVLFVTPLQGDREIAAAVQVGFNVTNTLHSVRVMGRDRPGSPRS